MKRLLIPILLSTAPPVQADDCVIILHGLARSALSMEVLATRLDIDGFTVVNKDYPSKKTSIRTLAHDILPAAVADCAGARRVHFVTHSMGGLLVRQYLKDADLPNLGHVVMMGPPNHGSPIVDEFKDVPGFDVFNGIAGAQLGTDPNSIPNQMGPVNFSLGVIAGTQHIMPSMTNKFGGPHDGKVSVESTKVEGMTDHITLPVTHTFMMNNPKVYDQVVAFLKTGRFIR